MDRDAKEVLKAKLWFAWPFVAGMIFIALATAFAFKMLSPPASDGQVGKSLPVDIEQLLDKEGFKEAYISANGGRQGLESLQTIHAKGVLLTNGEERSFSLLKKRPDKSLLTFDMGDYELTFGVHGEVVWQRVQAPGADPAYALKKGDEAAALKTMGEFYDPLLRTVAFAEGMIEAITLDEWNGRTALKVRFRPKEVETPMDAYLDPDTLRPWARTQRFKDGREKQVIYSDYRVVAGMQEPFVVETYIDGSLKDRLTFGQCNANVGIVQSVFEYPGKRQGLEEDGSEALIQEEL